MSGETDPFDDPPVIEEIAEAVLVPTRRFAFKSRGRPATYDGGVYDRDGRVVAAANHRAPYERHDPDPLLPATPSARLAGTYIYGGFLRPHFGHFLVEGLARLWAAERYAGKVDGIVYLPFRPPPKPSLLGRVAGALGWRGAQASSRVRVLGFVEPILGLYGLSCPVYSLGVPTRVERLIVPSQLSGNYNDARIAGHPVFRDFARGIGRTIAAPAAGRTRRLYVSRSRVPLLGKGGLLLERLIDDALAGCGYEVVHPELLPVDEQIALYRSSARILVSEGSALHLLALVADAEQEIGILHHRRAPEAPSKFDALLHAYAGRRPVSFYCPATGQVEAALRRPPQGTGPRDPNFEARGGRRKAIMVPDLAGLGQRLAAGGFIDAPWRVPAGTELRAMAEQEIAKLKREGKEYQFRVVDDPAAVAA